MIAVARKRGRAWAWGLENRYNSPMQQVRRAVDEGRLGRLHLGIASYVVPASILLEDEWHGTWTMTAAH